MARAVSGSSPRSVTGIAPNILSERLKRLEGERIVRATPYSERPPRFTYALTDEGLELAGVLRLLADWGSRGSAHAEPMRHAAVRHAGRGAPVVPDLRAIVDRAGGRRAPLRVSRRL